MSRAFVKEDDTGSSGGALPDRLISGHRNIVTAQGLAAIEAETARLAQEYSAAQASGDRVVLASVARDLRYWTARRLSAEVQADPPEDGPNDGKVHFGSRVVIERADGRQQTFRIVGEDEANPAQGTISYVSPLAQALMGKSVGDTARAGGHDAEIVRIFRT